jgi:hypothetical protein
MKRKRIRAERRAKERASQTRAAARTLAEQLAAERGDITIPNVVIEKRIRVDKHGHVIGYEIGGVER